MMRVPVSVEFWMIRGCIVQMPQRSDGYCCERGRLACSRDGKNDTEGSAAPAAMIDSNEDKRTFRFMT